MRDERRMKAKMFRDEHEKGGTADVTGSMATKIDNTAIAKICLLSVTSLPLLSFCVSVSLCLSDFDSTRAKLSTQERVSPPPPPPSFHQVRIAIVDSLGFSLQSRIQSQFPWSTRRNITSCSLVLGCCRFLSASIFRCPSLSPVRSIRPHRRGPSFPFFREPRQIANVSREIDR